MNTQARVKTQNKETMGRKETGKCQGSCRHTNYGLKTEHMDTIIETYQWQDRGGGRTGRETKARTRDKHKPVTWIQNKMTKEQEFMTTQHPVVCEGPQHSSLSEKHKHRCQWPMKAKIEQLSSIFSLIRSCICSESIRWGSQRQSDRIVRIIWKCVVFYSRHCCD